MQSKNVCCCQSLLALEEIDETGTMQRIPYIAVTKEGLIMEDDNDNSRGVAQGWGNQCASWPGDYPEVSMFALLKEFRDMRNTHLTYDAIVIRVLQRVAGMFNVSWSCVLETIKQGPCLLDADLHSQLECMMQDRTKPATLDEQHCVNRVLGSDYVQTTDVIKLAGILTKLVEDPTRVWAWFGVDGYLGDDPKRYVDGLRYGPDDFRGKHVRAVRKLYGDVKSPTR